MYDSGSLRRIDVLISKGAVSGVGRLGPFDGIPVMGFICMGF